MIRFKKYREIGFKKSKKDPKKPCSKQLQMHNFNNLQKN